MIDSAITFKRSVVEWWNCVKALLGDQIKEMINMFIVNVEGAIRKDNNGLLSREAIKKNMLLDYYLLSEGK